MTKEGTDWTHDFLEFLHIHYTGWDVPLNTFFEDEYGIEKTDTHRGEAVLELLKSLQTQNLITWTTQPGLDIVNTPPTLADYNWNARLTFPGLVYITNHLRFKEQLIIEKQNKRITKISLAILGLTMVFIAMTAITGVTGSQLKQLDSTLQSQQRYIKQMSTHLKSIDSLLQAKPFYDTSKTKKLQTTHL